MILNTNSIVQDVIQIKNGIIKHENGSVKNITHVKKIIAGILAHVFVRIASIKKVLMTLQWSSVMKFELLWILY